MRIHEQIGELPVSQHEIEVLQAALRSNAASTNDPRSKAVLNRLLQRCTDVVDTNLAGEEGLTLQQFRCSHEWAYTGTAYGGDDERWQGEGRCYCPLCGMDGDA